MRHLAYAITFCAVGLLTTKAYAADPPATQTKFFETQVRPLLVEHCQDCHGASKQKGGLRVDSRDALLKGGKNGPALVPGSAGKSKLIHAVRYADSELQMPPDEALPKEKVALLVRWVEMGAPWGMPTASGSTAGKSRQRTITDQDRAFWSFQPLRDVAAPAAVSDPRWNGNDVDRFVFAKLAGEGLSPAAPADRVALVRRAYFDLWGLPPTPQEIDAFVNDSSADAWEKLIDRLLASPHYGERWAQHWLDLVRYGESDGYRQDAFRSLVWPYRDYVIRSFNDDKPYDRFVAEQLAGDELNADDPGILIATAFLRHGMYEYNQRDVRTHWNSIVDEITDTAADVFLGLSMGCARCHDHKFDPILQADYYRLRAFFTPVLWRQDLSLATPEQKAAYAAKLKAWEEKTTKIREQLLGIERPFAQKTAEKAISIFPPDIQEMIRKPAEQRQPLEEQLARLALRQVYDKTEAGEAKVTGPQKAQHLELVRKLGDFDDFRPKPLMGAFVATDVGPVAPPTMIPGDKARRTFDPGYPTVLGHLPLRVPEIKATASSTGRRSALAAWLTQAEHPLTTRVMVNRIWQHHFGRGLVGTSSDFGRLGDQPSHPELLDYLARRFVSQGWSIKSMHRLIMGSAAYRQASDRPMPPVAREKDPENRWLWKYNARRLDAEQIRDAMLLTSGELRSDMFGFPVDPSLAKRTIYTKQIRNNRDPLLEAFDVPDSFASAADRNRTTTAMQSLFMMNGDWTLKRAEMMAARLREAGLKTPDEAARGAWKLAYGREPSEGQAKIAAGFLSRSRSGPAETIARSSAKSVDERPMLKTTPHRGSQAVYVRNARPDDMLRLPAGQSLVGDDEFTIEGYVLLESLYEDASVRVLVSQWDGKQTSPGWSLGVTSTKSRYEPRNLILQVVGDPARGTGGYEVIPSDFRIELHKTYYVAVSVRVKDPTEAGITFWLKDMTDNDAPLKSASVRHKVTGPLANPKAPLVIGGRMSAPVHGWDGLIDELRITRKALSKEELLYNDGTPPRQAICGHWVFEEQPGVFRDSAKVQPDLVKQAAAAAPQAATKNEDWALVDLCHVLLNSNAFLYVD